MAQENLMNLPESCCPVDALLRSIQRHRCLDCGKCTFGYEGAAQLELMLLDITAKKGRAGDYAQMQALCNMMKTQSLCEDGTALAETVLAVLEKYETDFSSHIAKKSCRAGVCKKFITYHILADRCIGCAECADVCEDDAILGKKRFVHVIQQDECTQCGACAEACEEDAIITAGAVKPRCPAKPIPCKKH